MVRGASFSSVKLPAQLVSQARAAAAPMRRSVAGQIEYWATLGRIAEAGGLTAHEAREAIVSDGARGQARVAEPDPTPIPADPVAAIETAFLQAEAQGTLAQAVRSTVQGNRRKALQAA